MTIETFNGNVVYPFQGLAMPVQPKAICGVRNDEQAPEELKGPLILFSGGLDSTYLVNEALKSSNVHLLYIVGNLNTEKVRLELEAREKIKKYFTDNPHSQYRIISDIILQFEVGDSYQAFNGVKLTQPVMWLYPSMLHYKSGLHTSVQIAYVKDDIIIPHLGRLKSAWESLTPIVKNVHIPLEFPICNVDKKDSHKSLSPELQSLLWVCERPMVNGKRESIECKECGPCKRRATYLVP